MIELLDIRKACNTLLKTNFSSIPVKSQDIEKGFVRPSFTVIFDELSNVTLESLIETSLKVYVYYFPELNTDDFYLNLDDVKYKLPLIFGNKLAVKDRFLDVNEPTVNVVDGIIVFEFDMLFYQDKSEHAAPLIEKLTYNGSEVS